MKNDTNPPNGADILIVDDQPQNLSVLMDALRARGYKVRPVTSGSQALEAARQQTPDLILLDINMPGMDGYQVCAELKSNPVLRAVPVIFVSAFDDTCDKVKGLGLGGVDYVTKPFQLEEVEARVSTHLELASLRKELQRDNEHLEYQVTVRTRKLTEANARLAVLDQSKSDFLSLLSHELRTPLCGIFGTTEIVLDKHAQTADAADYAKLVDLYAVNRKRILRLIEDAELLTRIGLQSESPTTSPCWLDLVVDHALGHAFNLAEARSVKLAPVPIALGQVHGSFDELIRAFVSLLETAIKFAKPNTVVQLSKADAPGEVSLLITAEGRSVPVEALPNFFDLMAHSVPLTSGGDLDLAPALAERIVRLYGGAVSVENLTPPGIRLTVRLKLAHELPKPEQFIRA